MSIVEHAEWKRLRRYVVIEDYKREGGERNPRFRIWLATDAPAPVVAAALAVELPCPACGATMHPFRRGNTGRSGRIYFAATCPLTVNIGCSRSSKASNEYQRVRAEVP